MNKDPFKEYIRESEPTKRDKGRDARWGARMGHKVFEDGVIDILTWPLSNSHNGISAENVARQYNWICMFASLKTVCHRRQYRQIRSAQALPYSSNLFYSRKSQTYSRPATTDNALSRL